MPGADGLNHYAEERAAATDAGSAGLPRGTDDGLAVFLIDALDDRLFLECRRKGSCRGAASSMLMTAGLYWIISGIENKSETLSTAMPIVVVCPGLQVETYDGSK